MDENEYQKKYLDYTAQSKELSAPSYSSAYGSASNRKAGVNWNKYQYNPQQPVDASYESYLPDKKRGFLDRSFDLLNIGTYASQGFFTDGVDGMMKGIQAGNPFGKGYEEGEYTFDDTLNKYTDWEEWQPDKWYSKMGKGAVNLAGDIFLDPLTYMTFGIGGVAKGTGTVVAKGLGKEAVERVSREAIEAMVKKTGKEVTEDAVTRYTAKINKMRGINDVEGLFSNDIRIGLSAMWGGTKGTVKLVDGAVMKKIGDATIAPYFNAIRKKMGESSVAKLFNTSFELRKLASSDPEQAIKYLATFDQLAQIKKLKIIGDKEVRQYVEQALSGFNSETQKKILNYLETPGAWKPFVDLEVIKDTDAITSAKKLLDDTISDLNMSKELARVNAKKGAKDVKGLEHLLKDDKAIERLLSPETEYMKRMYKKFLDPQDKYKTYDDALSAFHIDKLRKPKEVSFLDELPDILKGYDLPINIDSRLAKDVPKFDISNSEYKTKNALIPNADNGLNNGIDDMGIGFGENVTSPLKAPKSSVLDEVASTVDNAGRFSNSPEDMVKKAMQASPTQEPDALTSVISDLMNDSTFSRNIHDKVTNSMGYVEQVNMFNIDKHANIFKQRGVFSNWVKKTPIEKAKSLNNILYDGKEIISANSSVAQLNAIAKSIRDGSDVFKLSDMVYQTSNEGNNVYRYLMGIYGTDGTGKKAYSGITEMNEAVNQMNKQINDLTRKKDLIHKYHGDTSKDIVKKTYPKEKVPRTKVWTEAQEIELQKVTNAREELFQKTIDRKKELEYVKSLSREQFEHFKATRGDSTFSQLEKYEKKYLDEVKNLSSNQALNNSMMDGIKGIDGTPKMSDRIIDSDAVNQSANLTREQIIKMSKDGTKNSMEANVNRVLNGKEGKVLVSHGEELMQEAQQLTYRKQKMTDRLNDYIANAKKEIKNVREPFYSTHYTDGNLVKQLDSMQSGIKSWMDGTLKLADKDAHLTFDTMYESISKSKYVDVEISTEQFGKLIKGANEGGNFSTFKLPFVPYADKENLFKSFLGTQMGREVRVKNSITGEILIDNMDKSVSPKVKELIDKKARIAESLRTAVEAKDKRAISFYQNQLKGLDGIEDEASAYFLRVRDSAIENHKKMLTESAKTEKLATVQKLAETKQIEKISDVIPEINPAKQELKEIMAEYMDDVVEGAGVRTSTTRLPKGFKDATPTTMDKLTELLEANKLPSFDLSSSKFYDNVKNTELQQVIDQSEIANKINKLSAHIKETPIPKGYLRNAETGELTLESLKGAVSEEDLLKNLQKQLDDARATQDVYKAYDDALTNEITLTDLINARAKEAKYTIKDGEIYMNKIVRRLSVDDPDLSQEVVHVINELSDKLLKMGLDEASVGKLKTFIDAYAPHIVNPAIKDNPIIMEQLRKTNPDLYKKVLTYAGDKFNPHGMGRSADFRNAFGSTVREINDAMKPLLKKQGVDEDFFINEIGDAYLARALKSNDVIYSNKFIDEMVGEFGTRLTRESIENKGIYYVTQKDLKQAFSTITPEKQMEVLGLMGFKQDKIYNRMLIEVTGDEYLKMIDVANKYGGELTHAYTLPKYVAQQASNLGYSQMLRETGAFLKAYDNFTLLWKTAVTVANPGFHARNAVSNNWQNYLAVGTETFNPKVRSMVKGVLSNQQGDLITNAGKAIPYEEIRTLAVVHDIVSSDKFLKRSITNADQARSMVGKELQGKSEGILSAIGKRVDAPPSQLTKRLDPTDTANFFIYEWGRNVGQGVEDYDRMINFVAGLKSGLDPIRASEQVEKFLFDYADITAFEKNVMKRIIPFYTWLRKNAPLQIEAMMTQPGKYRMVSKATMEANKGMSQEERSYLPEFMQDWVQLPIELNDQGVNKQMMINPNMPYGNVDNLEPSMKNVVGMMNPLIKAGIEIPTNTNMFFGNKIWNGETFVEDIGKYGMNQTGWVNSTMKTIEGGLNNDLDGMLNGIAYTTGVKTRAVDMDEAKKQAIYSAILKAEKNKTLTDEEKREAIAKKLRKYGVE